jgi:uncharacterized protein (TIGR03435 family)
MKDSVLTILLALFLAAGWTLGAQSPAFDVASVKTAADPGMIPMFCLVPCSPGERLTVEGARVDIRYMSLSRLILTAYRIKAFQLSGPDWMKTQRFDIVAKIPEGVSKDKVPEMLQALLAERFKLSIHRESRDQPVYALVVGKNGLKLQQATADADAALPKTPGGQALYTPDGEGSVDANGNLAVTGGQFGPIRGGRGLDRSQKRDFLKATMPGLAELLRPHEDRPVIDMTNLKGAYRFTFEILPPPPGDGGRKGGTAADGGTGGRSGGGGTDAEMPRDVFGEGLFKAIEKAGLKLERSKAPVDTIVVDRLEKSRAATNAADSVGWPRIPIIVSRRLYFDAGGLECGARRNQC